MPSYAFVLHAVKSFGSSGCCGKKKQKIKIKKKTGFKYKKNYLYINIELIKMKSVQLRRVKVPAAFLYMKNKYVNM